MGRRYYIDHNTHLTTWERPLPAFDSQTASDSQTTLPDGWEERLTPEGETYYVDHHTRTTSWVDPRMPGAGTHLGPLPVGWEMRLTKRKRVYFVDHNTRTTTWDDPRLPTVSQLARRASKL